VVIVESEGSARVLLQIVARHPEAFFDAVGNAPEENRS